MLRIGCTFAQELRAQRAQSVIHRCPFAARVPPQVVMLVIVSLEIAPIIVRITTLTPFESLKYLYLHALKVSNIYFHALGKSQN